MLEMAARAYTGAAAVPRVLEACLGRDSEGPSQLAFEMAARRVLSSGRLLSAATSARLSLASCMDMHGSAQCFFIFSFSTSEVPQ